MSVKDLILYVEASKVPGYRQDAADSIVHSMEGGLSFLDACRKAGVSREDGYRWRRLNVENFAVRVDESTQVRAESMLEDGHTAILEAETRDELTRAKLLIEHARWLAERAKPDKYSPAIVSAEANRPVVNIAAMVVVPPKENAPVQVSAEVVKP